MGPKGALSQSPRLPRSGYLGYKHRHICNPTGVAAKELLRHAQSLSVVYLHLVFSTKERRPFLRDKTQRLALHAYLGGISKTLDCPPLSYLWD